VRQQSSRSDEAKPVVDVERRDVLGEQRQVGHHGIGSRRRGASARTWPLWIWPTISETLAKKMSICPAATSAIAGAPPRYGTCRSFSPRAAAANSSAPSWWVEPLPVEP